MVHVNTAEPRPDRYVPPAASASRSSEPARQAPSRLLTPILALVFVISGAAGLIYESIWSRYLSLFVGHSAYAQVIVLVIFLGGMSIGALLVGERSSRVTAPLYWYAAVELAVGLIGFVFHDVFTWATAMAYDHWLPAIAGGPMATVVKWGLAGLLILPQSVLLGTTFPLMSAGVMRLRTRPSGHVLGLLYFANSIGAAFGVLLAGFTLVRLLGFPGTLLTAASLNFVAALVVWTLARFGSADDSTPMEAVAAVAEDRPHALSRLLLVVSFGTALSSFIYEIGWIRMLSLVLGSATHSFELMLSAFILGLALGALWVRRRADSFADPVRALGLVQWAMGALAIATLPMYVQSFEWTHTLLQMLDRTPEGYAAFGLARYVLCLLVMLPATFCAGMTLPLITHTLMQAGGGERAIGRVYGINTLGSIVGAALAGLVLMPLLGLKTLLVAGALVDIGLGIALLAHVRRAGSTLPRFTLFAGIATAALVASVAGFTRFDRTRLVSGVYRHGALPHDGAWAIPFYKDGRTATVSVRYDPSDSLRTLSLATNGKPDASLDRRWIAPYRPGTPPLALTRDQGTQLLAPIVSLAHTRTPRRAAVIGQGSGVTSHVLLGDPRIERLYTIEIEPEMIRGSRQFYPANRRVFDDPRSTFVIDDAKAFFASSPQKFDLIFSEPSNPWVSGVSGLFTEEFYRRAKRQLAPGGVFGQWLHLYEIDDDLVATVLAAIDEVFPDYEIYYTASVDIMIVASADGPLPSPDWAVAQRGGIGEDMRRVRPMPPQAFEALRVAGRGALHPWLTRNRANSDYYPVLDLGTERARFLQSAASGMLGLGRGRFDLMAALSERREPLPDFALTPTPEIQRSLDAALGVNLRALWAGRTAGIDTTEVRAREAAYLVRTVQRSVASPLPPSDWRLWTVQVIAVEAMMHAGSAGVADENFYGPVRAYLARMHPPAEAKAAIDFAHGIATWNWDETARASDPLIAAAVRGEDWVPLYMLREGSAFARVKQGDPAAARRVFATLRARSGGDWELRDQLLFARILDLEARRRATR